jgi:hypothetical protein
VECLSTSKVRRPRHLTVEEKQHREGYTYGTIRSREQKPAVLAGVWGKQHLNSVQNQPFVYYWKSGMSALREGLEGANITKHKCLLFGAGPALKLGFATTGRS